MRYSAQLKSICQDHFEWDYGDSAIIKTETLLAALKSHVTVDHPFVLKPNIKLLCPLTTQQHPSHCIISLNGIQIEYLAPKRKDDRLSPT